MSETSAQDWGRFEESEIKLLTLGTSIYHHPGEDVLGRGDLEDLHKLFILYSQTQNVFWI